MKRLVNVMILLLVVSASQAAPFPAKLNYQGYLTDSIGNPITSAGLAMTFKIYGQATSGSALWTETRSSVPVSAGRFNVNLGEMGGTPESVFGVASSGLWLGITIGADLEMTPRAQLTAVPFAFRVENLDSAAGGTINGDVNVNGKASMGQGNFNSGVYSFVFGENGQAGYDHASVTGGVNNRANGNYSHVGGGLDNNIDGGADYSFIGGGSQNHMSENTTYGVIGGGVQNSVNNNAAVLGGTRNSATGGTSVAVGGEDNRAQGDHSTVCGGDSNTSNGDLSFTGGGLWNTSGGVSSFVGGGERNSAAGDVSTVVGGGLNGCNGYASFVGGGEISSANGTHSAVSGGYGNLAGGAYSSVVGGEFNRARGSYSFVGGGGGATTADSNSAMGDKSVIGGGWNNVIASGAGQCTIGGGAFNRCGADGIPDAAIGGGSFNHATGTASCVPGGRDNAAGGSYSFAAGHRAKANHNGCFVWGDSYDGDLTSSGSDQFRARASGGVTFYTNTSLNSGVTVGAGGNAWVSVSDSTKKRNMRGADTRSILEAFRRLPIKQWEYKSEKEGIQHIGPMAQDFWNGFHLGSDPLGIATIDADGVVMAAVQELANRNERLEARNQKLEEDLAALREQVQTLIAGDRKAMKEGK